MLFACWSMKGGSGTTVTAASLALAVAHHAHGTGGALLVDLAGDLPAALGLPPPQGAGVREWLAAAAVPADGLGRLEVPVVEGLHLLPRGAGSWGGLPATRLLAALGSDERTVVVDCGTLPVAGGADAPLEVAAGATRSILVVRPCYLALARAQAAPVRPSQLVVVREPGRALTTPDVAHVLGVPVLAEIPLDPAVARAVDAGVLRHRLPRAVERTLRGAA